MNGPTKEQAGSATQTEQSPDELEPCAVVHSVRLYYIKFLHCTSIVFYIGIPAQLESTDPASRLRPKEIECAN